MIKRSRIPLFAIVILSLTATLTRGAGKPFEFADGDRIALVGNEFFERELDDAWIETQLTTRFPEKHLTFRNMGYSGDTVQADARSLCAGWDNFGPADQGFNRLKELVGHVKPTVIFVAYGMNESFDGEKGLANFQAGLNRMLDMLAAGGARLVLISPIRHENLRRPYPDPAEHNRKLGLYVAAMASTAGQRNIPLIDLFTQDVHAAMPLTRDGVHLTPFGYWYVAGQIEAALGYPPREWSIELNADGKVGTLVGTTLSDVKAEGNTLAFTTHDQYLTTLSAPGGKPLWPHAWLTVKGLPTGKYELKSDGKTLLTTDAAQLAEKVALPGDQPIEQVMKLMALIHAKNVDFFNYWRPENDTYILGYRKGEQGRNAVEIPRFEPLAAEKDAEIAKLAVPTPVAYTLSPVK